MKSVSLPDPEERARLLATTHEAISDFDILIKEETSYQIVYEALDGLQVRIDLPMQGPSLIDSEWQQSMATQFTIDRFLRINLFQIRTTNQAKPPERLLFMRKPDTSLAQMFGVFDRFRLFTRVSNTPTVTYQPVAGRGVTYNGLYTRMPYITCRFDGSFRLSTLLDHLESLDKPPAKEEDVPSSWEAVLEAMDEVTKTNIPSSADLIQPQLPNFEADPSPSQVPDQEDPEAPVTRGSTSSAELLNTENMTYDELMAHVSSSHNQDPSSNPQDEDEHPQYGEGQLDDPI